MRQTAHNLRGFTLIEMIMVITLTGILAGMVAVFIKAPVDSYIDMSRRAELSDIADTAVRRMTRDIRSALPNSVRNPVDSSDQCIEFMPSRSGGRYRAEQTVTPTGDILDFLAIDASFDMLGLNSNLPTSAQIAAGDVVVVYNDGSASGNAYTGLNAIQIAAGGVVAPGDTAGTTKLTFVAAAGGTLFVRKLLPAASPSNRFQVMSSTEQVVSYACSGGKLYRHSRNITARTASWDQPATCAAMSNAPTASAILASSVSSCSILYDSTSGTGRFGIVSVSLKLTQSGESVNLYHQVHVDNSP